MNIKKINSIVDGDLYNYQKINIKSFKIDSRKIGKNDCFISLTDEYIDDAIKRGAKLIISESMLDIDIPYIKVKDIYEVLFKISKYYVTKSNVPIIAITGSNGKTTTKELIYDVLSTKYKVLKNEKNFNNHMGVPLTLFNLNNSYDYCVLEFGMNHLGEIKRLKELTDPELSIITNIGTSHIGNLGSIRKICKAKCEIINKKLIVNDSKYLKKLDAIRVSINDITNLECNLEGSRFNIVINNKEYHIDFKVPGKHLITNILIAIKVGLMYGVEEDLIVNAINNYKGIDNRMEIIKKEYIIINDCYNSSYESLMGAIELMSSCDKKFYILGDILELGKYSKKIHKKIIKNLDGTILTVGEYMKAGIHFKDTDELINYLDRFDLNGATILVKASHKLEFNKITDYLRK